MNCFVNVNVNTVDITRSFMRMLFINPLYFQLRMYLASLVGQSFILRNKMIIFIICQNRALWRRIDIKLQKIPTVGHKLSIPCSALSCIQQTWKWYSLTQLLSSCPLVAMARMTKVGRERNMFKIRSERDHWINPRTDGALSRCTIHARSWHEVR